MSFSFNQAKSRLMVVDTEPVLVHTDSFNGEFHWHTDDSLKVEGHPNTDYHSCKPVAIPNDELCQPRPCVHLFNQPAPGQLLSTSWAFQLQWYPTLYLIRDTPVIACRVGLDVTFAFDCRGPMAGCENMPTSIATQNKFTYRLHPVVWDDDKTAPAPNVLIGIQK